MYNIHTTWFVEMVKIEFVNSHTHQMNFCSVTILKLWLSRAKAVYVFVSLYFQPDFISPVDDDPGPAVARGPQRDVLHRQTRSLGQEVKLGPALAKLLVPGISTKWLESSHLKPGPLLNVD